MPSLFTKGCLGTCWYGKYHYLEPWTGCEHGCLYCYARFRSDVTNKLAAQSNSFETPALNSDKDKISEMVRKEVAEKSIRVVKLSRYTDIFTPCFVKDGSTLEVLRTLCDTPVERIIITTKGAPDNRLVELMGAHPQKFSYNLAAKPESSLKLEPKLLPLEHRLEMAAKVSQAGIRTTIHMDPLMLGIEDEPQILEKFLRQVQGFGLKRVMFSLMLLSPEIIAHIEKHRGQGALDELLRIYDCSEAPQFLPNQHETRYFSVRPEIKKQRVQAIAKLLREMGFEFVLCSLKSVIGNQDIKKDDCPLCDGKFYA